QVRIELLERAQGGGAIAGDAGFVTATPHEEIEGGHDALLVLGDQHAVAYAACASARAGANGSVKEKVDPRPGSLATQSRPPRRSTISRQMARPRPVPAGFCVSVSPTWRNFSKIAFWCSRPMPTPLSSTSTRTWSSSSLSRTSTRPLPASQNFTALESKFS